MDWPRIIGIAATTIISGALCLAMIRGGLQPPVLVGESYEIGPSPIVRWFAIGAGVLLLGFVALCLGLIIAGEADEELQRIAWIAVPMLAALGIAALCESRVRLWMDRDGIRGRTAFRGRRGVRWDELEKVSYSNTSSCLVLRDRHGEKLRVSTLHRGHNYLFDVLIAKVPEEVWAEGLRRYVAHRGGRINAGPGRDDASGPP